VLPEPAPHDLDVSDYRRLAEFRHQIRRFLHFSENAARDHGLEPRQHQLLLAVKGLPEHMQPTIGVIARRLFLRHHTTVELVDRLVKLDVVRRERSMQDAREVFIRLTPKGEDVLRELSLVHRRELDSMGLELSRALSEAIRGAERAA
jgi:DNA-binding MarR family transcriptional regulator